MSIKMRVASTGKSKSCNSCGKGIDKSLDLFDVRITGEANGTGGFQFTLCDVCMDALFYKSLKATSYTNNRIKQPRDIKLINKRNRGIEDESDPLRKSVEKKF